MIFLHRSALLYCFNTLWQIPLLYFAASLSDKLLQHSSPITRYRLWTAAFLLCFILPIVSSTGYPRAYLEHAMLQTRQVSRSASLEIVARADRRHALPDTNHSLLRSGTGAQFLLVLWAACMLYRTARITWGYGRIGQIIDRGYKPKQTRLRFGLSPSLLVATEDAFKVLISEEVGIPATARILQPVVLLPKVLADTALPCDLDAVFAHEHAHIVRRDYMWNLVFEILAIPAAYNPLMRRLLGRIAETREFICDRMAAESMGNAARYAQALVRISEMLLKPIPSINPALRLFDGRTLENRVMSLLHPIPPSRRNWNALMVLLSVSIFAPCCIAAVGLPYQPAALVSSDLQPYSGTWHWMFKGKPFATMQLVADKDHFTGYMTNGFFSYDGDGNMTDAGSHPGRSAIVRTFFAGSTLHIVVQDDQDKSLSEWAMTLTGPKSAEFTTADPEAPKNFKPWTAERSAD